MNGRKKMSIALIVGALVVFIVSAFVLLGGHNKTGIGLIVSGFILLGLGAVAFYLVLHGGAIQRMDMM